MRLMLAVLLLAGSASTLEAQVAVGTCFELTVSDPFWRASETVDQAPTDAAPRADILRGGPLRFRLDGDGRYTWNDADLFDLDVGAPHELSDWEYQAPVLSVWWGEAWYEVTLGQFEQGTDGIWRGSLRISTDVVLFPDPGEWRYGATLTEIDCDQRGAGSSN